MNTAAADTIHHRIRGSRQVNTVAARDSSTDRERDVLAQVGAGRSNAEIGTILHISPDTARTYVGRLLGKLAARDRSQLVVIAYESGLVRPGDQ